MSRTAVPASKVSIRGRALNILRTSISSRTTDGMAADLSDAVPGAFDFDNATKTLAFVRISEATWTPLDGSPKTVDRKPESRLPDSRRPTGWR